MFALIFMRSWINDTEVWLTNLPRYRRVVFVQIRSRGKIRDVYEIFCLVLGVWKEAFVTGTNSEERLFGYSFIEWTGIQCCIIWQLFTEVEVNSGGYLPSFEMARYLSINGFHRYEANNCFNIYLASWQNCPKNYLICNSKLKNDCF